MKCRPCPHPKKHCWCLEHPGVGKNKTIEQIKKSIGWKHGVAIKDMESLSRKKHVVIARFEAMAECRQHTNASLKEIGSFFNRNHSTVLHAIKIFNRRVLSAIDQKG